MAEEALGELRRFGTVLHGEVRESRALQPDADARGDGGVDVAGLAEDGQCVSHGNGIIPVFEVGSKQRAGRDRSYAARKSGRYRR